MGKLRLYLSVVSVTTIQELYHGALPLSVETLGSQIEAGESLSREAFSLNILNAILFSFPTHLRTIIY